MGADTLELHSQSVCQGRPLLVEGNEIYIYSSGNLCAYQLPSMEMRNRWAIPSEKIVPNWRRPRLLERLFRLGLHHLGRRTDTELFGIGAAHLYRFCTQNCTSAIAVKFRNGSRPLNTAIDPGGRIFFGDYFSNVARKEVHIYGSSDGEGFTVVYTFPGGKVRHVHGLIWDTFRGGFWVLTGDSNRESGLWFTDDGFRTLTEVYGGSQAARAVTIIPMEKGLIVPMDSPLEANWINFLDLDDISVTPLKQIAGSAFFSAEVSGYKFISTVVEPSDVNLTKNACLYGSLDGYKWSLVDKIHQDFLSDLGLVRYFGYPRIQLPTHSNTKQPVLYAGGLSLAAHDNSVLQWDLESLNRILLD